MKDLLPLTIFILAGDVLKDGFNSRIGIEREVTRRLQDGRQGGRVGTGDADADQVSPEELAAAVHSSLDFHPHVPAYNADLEGTEPEAQTARGEFDYEKLAEAMERRAAGGGNGKTKTKTKKAS